jgi:hypothetical protein
MTRQMRGWTTLAGTILVMLLGGGCLQREVTETWYLDPSGAVTWSVIEREVRSDAQDALDRQNEEEAYWMSVQRDDHPVGRGLRLLDPVAIRTIPWRREAPFTVVTEARFPSIELLGRRLIERLGWPASSVVVRADDVRTWTLTLRDPQTAGDSDHFDDDLMAIAGDLDQLRVVLTAGRFQDAVGFTISADARVAVIAWPDGTNAERPTVVLRLTWR